MDSIYNIGIIIKSLREKKNMSQSKLADGICSLRQLSRIEKNISNPSFYILKRFSERLGEDISSYLLYSYCNDPIYVARIFQKIENSFLKLDYAEILSIIENIPATKYADFELKDTKQLLTWYSYVSLSNLNIKNVTIDDYIELLRITTDKDLNELCNFPLSPTELKIIHSIISLYSKNLMFDKAEPLLKSLIINIEEKYYKIDISLYNQLLYNLAKLYFLKKEYKKSIFFAQKGINSLLEHNTLIPLLDFYYLKGKAYESINNHKYAIQCFKNFIQLTIIQGDPPYTNKAKIALIKKYKGLI